MNDHNGRAKRQSFPLLTETFMAMIEIGIAPVQTASEPDARPKIGHVPLFSHSNELVWHDLTDHPVSPYAGITI
jgi:hypothetical protein